MKTVYLLIIALFSGPAFASPPLEYNPEGDFIPERKIVWNCTGKDGLKSKIYRNGGDYYHYQTLWLKGGFVMSVYNEITGETYSFGQPVKRSATEGPLEYRTSKDVIWFLDQMIFKKPLAEVRTGQIVRATLFRTTDIQKRIDDFECSFVNE